MRILVVGAGAVGQVYGNALQAGGATVSVFVRDKYAAGARRGYALTRIPLLGRRLSEQFVPNEVLTTADEVRERRFEQIWLCVATDALAGTWLEEVLEACVDATVVCLQPGLDVKARLVSLVPESRVAFGMIGMLAFSAPLEGSVDRRELDTPASVAYFHPPAGSTRVSSTSERRALDVVGALRAGRAPAELCRDANEEMGFSSAMLVPHIAALEVAGWAFAAYRASNAPELGAAASREALRLTSALTGADAPIAASLLLPPLVRFGSRFSRIAAPFDVESFLRVHFTKVATQTRLMIEEWRGAAEARGLEHEGLAALVEELEGEAAQSAGEDDHENLGVDP